MISVTRKIWLYALLAAMTLSVTGCIYEDGLPEEPFDGDLSLVLHVAVLDTDNGAKRSAIASRADDYTFELPENTTEQLQTLRVIIVNTADRMIVHNYYQKLNQPANSYVDLRFKVDFSKKYNVYLIGNEMGLGNAIVDMLQGLAPNGTYTAGTIENLTMATAEAGTPIIDNSGRNRTIIPMTEKFEVNTMARPTSGPQSQVIDQKESLFITRALSKFSFNFYRTADYSGVSLDEIKTVKITGLGKNQYVLPNNAVYDPVKETVSTNRYGGRVITGFDVPADNELAEYVFDLPDNLGLVSQYPEFSPSVLPMSYQPQFYFTESLGMTGTDKFQCSISFDGENYLPPVTLPNLPSLPRNTHVIVNIIVGNNNALLLTVTVMPWVPVYNEFDFTHNIAMAEDGTLTFTAGTYASLDKTTGRLVLGEFPMAAVGTFGISEPIGAIWTASLVTTAGELNALQFQVTDADGNTTTTSTISGTIDGKKTSFRVVPVMAAGAVQRAAEMQVIVTFDDGQSAPVSILKSTEYGTSPNTVDNITFIQNPQQ